MPQSQRPLGSPRTRSTPENAYANTTPFPNSLISEVMPTLKDTEWRLLCVVVRQTLGWVDPSTGGRKLSDWMTQGQLIQKTGRNSEAISKALDSLIQQNLLQARNKAKKTLMTTSQRRQVRGHIYYALHPLLLQRLRNEHGKVEETKGGDFGSNAGNNEDKKQGDDDEIEKEKPVKSEYEEHSKTEYQQATVYSVFEGEDPKSEYPRPRKPNTTKENTKQTPSNKDFRGARSSETCAPEINKRNIFEKQEVLPLLPERRFDARPREKGKENEEADNLNAAAREIVSAYAQDFKAQFPEKERALLTPDIVNQLEQCCEKHGSQTLLMLLPSFFESDYAFASRNEYSLWSFLHSINVLLYGSKRFVSLANQLAKARKANLRTTNSHIGKALLHELKKYQISGLNFHWRSSVVYKFKRKKYQKRDSCNKAQE